MKSRTLGSNGPEVSAIGLSCMGLSFGLGPATSHKEALQVIRSAVDRGVTLFDTAEGYGPFVNEELVGEALMGVRNQVQICTKFGFAINGRNELIGFDSRPKHIREVVDASLKRLPCDKAILCQLTKQQHLNVLFAHLTGSKRVNGHCRRGPTVNPSTATEFEHSWPSAEASVDAKCVLSAGYRRACGALTLTTSNDWWRPFP